MACGGLQEAFQNTVVSFFFSQGFFLEKLTDLSGYRFTSLARDFTKDIQCLEIKNNTPSGAR